MSARKVELHHNTPDQVESFIRSALTLVEVIDPPDDLREAVFNAGVAMISARQIQWEQVGPMMAIPRNHG